MLEIGEGGAVTVHDRPETTLPTGATPIVRDRVARGRSPFKATSNANIAQAAEDAALSPDLIAAVGWRESRMRAGAMSPAGAIGEMQLMPGTARALGVDPHDSRQNIAGGAVYLAGLMKRYDGDLVRALAAYNAGSGAVDRYGGIPPYKETRDYVAAILERLSQSAVALPER